MGEVTLATTFGDNDVQATLNVTWIIVDVPSAYNTILGLPTQVQLKAVTSPYYLMMKFMSGDKVGRSYGSQSTDRECYIASLKDKTPPDTQPSRVMAVEG
ncbi:hypothetical protein Dimus_038161 [Dionaea muscipula]